MGEESPTRSRRDKKHKRRHRSRSKSPSRDKPRHKSGRSRHDRSHKHRSKEEGSSKETVKTLEGLADLHDLWVEKPTPVDQPDKPTQSTNNRSTSPPLNQERRLLPNFDDRGLPLNLDQDPLLRHLQPKVTETSHKSQRAPQSAMEDGKDDSILTLLHQERYANQASMDKQMAQKISRNARFEDDLEYLDDHAEVLAQTRHGLTNQQKQNLAISDYKSLASCPYCFQTPEKDASGDATPTPPRIPVVSIGTQVYLGLPAEQPLVPGHCVIVPLQHTVSTLNCEDDAWTEIRNFMKCLLYAFDAQQRTVVFLETVTNVTPRNGRHVVIECIPIPKEFTDEIAVYFKEAILTADDEWTQHRKVIDTSLKQTKLSDLKQQTPSFAKGSTSQSESFVTTGGFRKTLTPKVPYFHVWLTLDGGLGHVIENNELFPHYFGKQVIAGMLDLPPNLYRRPPRLGSSVAFRRQRVNEFRKLTHWGKYDWTSMIK
ncbi:Pre-mRNA-splicing factor cwf19 [Dispira parvispora]|uniref:Pre-mRNA-splicing factor cwf19 n=1 Tax=Dispira parvispora TaxID=1520584 RepID=A0A9W8E867_9FUNG|nr:Pre-mRNA-splicing factor cwf19 [Dispira parvispora]